MGVYIKGIKMPKDCYSCTVVNSCKWMINNEIGKIHPNCPLVEVPEPHEKLVEFIDVATFEDEDSGTEKVNLGEAFAAYFKMREAKPVIETEN